MYQARVEKNMSKEQLWYTAQWFVTPRDYEQEVVDRLHFLRDLQIHDITLHDGEKQAGVTFTREDKIRTARKLDEAGVHRIEAGMPAVSDQHEVATKEIASLGLTAGEFRDLVTSVR